MQVNKTQSDTRQSFYNRALEAGLTATGKIGERAGSGVGKALQHLGKAAVPGTIAAGTAQNAVELAPRLGTEWNQFANSLAGRTDASVAGSAVDVVGVGVALAVSAATAVLTGAESVQRVVTGHASEAWLKAASRL